MVSFFKIFLTTSFYFLLAFFHVGASEEISAQNLYGTYCVKDVERYRGGLTSSEKALSRQHESVLISEDEFSLWGEEVYENPIYEIFKNSIMTEEGEVPNRQQRFGSFYGYGVERETVITLRAYNTSAPYEGFVFEVVDACLWLFLDGWFYKLEKKDLSEVSNCDSAANQG